MLSGPHGARSHTSNPHFRDVDLQHMHVGRLSALPFIVGMCATYAIFFAAVFGNLPSALFGIIWILVVASIMLLIIARLHDAEYNGWWWPLVMFTSLLGLIAVSAVSGHAWSQQVRGTAFRKTARSGHVRATGLAKESNYACGILTAYARFNIGTHHRRRCRA